MDDTAGPFEMGEGNFGVLLLHGLTGTPQSMRLWGESLAAEGFRVVCPLLPGHGTSWRQLARASWRDWLGAAADALEELTTKAERTFLAGLSMGGALALYLGAENPGVSKVVTVNAAVMTTNPLRHAVPILKHFLPSVPGVASDIADPSMKEIAYDRLPTAAAEQLLELQYETRLRLASLTQPLLLYHSRQDHVVEPANLDYIAAHAGSPSIWIRRLDSSYHVATLDYDREVIFKESAHFFLDRSVK